MERRKFEDSFKEAFNGAEVAPSDSVWTGIELELEKAEGDKTRRRLLFYKMLAAASVTFAMCVAGVGYLVVSHQQETFNERLTSTGETAETKNGEAVIRGIESDDASTSVAARESNESSENSNNRIAEVNRANATNDAPSRGTNHEPVQSISKTDLASEANVQENIVMDNENVATSGILLPETVQDKYADRALPLFYSARSPQLKVDQDKPDPGAVLLAKLAAEEQAYARLDKREKEQKAERLWTSVGFAAGGFSSVNPSVSPTATNNMIAMSNSTVPDKQSKAAGVAYSMGVNVGAKLSKRWLIQGGLNYLSQSSDYIATNVVAENNYTTFKSETVNELNKLPQIADAYASGGLTPTVPYSVNNNVKFLSVPVQAGYLLVNQKFGLQLNAGVSTDLFLQNTITPEGGSLDKTTQGRGEDSPYRSVNFSGLMGTEFSYRFGTHYRVALNPGLRYPLNSVYKEDIGIQSTPVTFDLGLRFRYIFH